MWWWSSCSSANGCWWNINSFIKENYGKGAMCKRCSPRCCSCISFVLWFYPELSARLAHQQHTSLAAQASPKGVEVKKQAVTGGWHKMRSGKRANQWDTSPKVSPYAPHSPREALSYYLVRAFSAQGWRWEGSQSRDVCSSESQKIRQTCVLSQIEREGKKLRW